MFVYLDLIGLLVVLVECCVIMDVVLVGEVYVFVVVYLLCGLCLLVLINVVLDVMDEIVSKVYCVVLDKFVVVGVIIVEVEVLVFSVLVVINVKGGFIVVEVYVWYCVLIVENVVGYD